MDLGPGFKVRIRMDEKTWIRIRNTDISRLFAVHTKYTYKYYI